MTQQHILSDKLVVLIPPCLIIELLVSTLQVCVTRLEIRGTLPSPQNNKVWSNDGAKKMLNPSIAFKTGNETEELNAFKIRMRPEQVREEPLDEATTPTSILSHVLHEISYPRVQEEHADRWIPESA